MPTELWQEAWELAREYKKRCLRDLLRNRVLWPLQAELRCAERVIDLAREQLPTFERGYAIDKPIESHQGK